MKKSALTAALSIGIMSIGLAFATPQQAVAQLKQNSTQVLNILQNAKNNNDVQVRRQAENYAIPYFDFARMTELAVGANWRNATPAQKTALTEQFKTLLIRTYSGTMLQYRNANAVIRENAVQRGNSIIVTADITPAGGKPVTMDYTMYQSGGKYRVYNVAVEGASLVTVYRSQFNNTIAQKGIDGLIQELRSKNGS
ncbi:transporter [Eikenella sp. NML96-A-049]|uniref:MlaC/ttg2D family ABC transporter substrate-binding protein n=1 Tax=unclassified Eikenella TaxID=2639367 RepID=UPI0007DFA33D|nr:MULTISPECIES: ABC transporter substrate-binding protein [unclassified Eikenella]OAM33385.1 transporter [Eikenella sp. NML070372]OAM40307.1 transporter [Eikenella sp. NML96-A-049]